MAVEVTKKVRHVDYMDGLRGVLVLNVLLLHIFFAVVTVPGVALPWYNWTQLWFQPGMVGESNTADIAQSQGKRYILWGNTGAIGAHHRNPRNCYSDGRRVRGFRGDD